MLNHIIRTCVLGLVASAALVLPAASEAQAQTCNSEASCRRHAICPVGFQIAKNGDSFSCSQSSSAATATPTCSALNSMNDWSWSAANKRCRRVRNNGQEVLATENITCGSGFTYSAASGLCTKPASTMFARIQLNSSATAQVMPSPTGLCSTANACTNTVKCPSTFSMRTYASNAYACTKTEAASSVNPTCSALNNMNDWSWSAANKRCRRVRNNSQEVLATENITCAAGFTYSAAAGQCTKPGGTFWSTPQL
jgi:hypothetical protein